MEKQAFIETAITSNTDECILWPWGKTGAGYASLSNKLIHRLVCERVYGPPPKGFHAAHRCGTKACINWRHIRWASVSENNQERRDHGRLPFGENHWKAKLTEAQVRAIMGDGRSLNTVARAFGVSKKSILLILQGKTWRHITAPASVRIASAILRDST